MRSLMIVFGMLAAVSVWAADWQYHAVDGEYATSIVVDEARRRVLVGTLEGYWFGDLAVGQWNSRTMPGWIGREVWAILDHPDHDQRVITGRVNAWFKGYLELTDSLETEGAVVWESNGGKVNGLARDPNDADRMYGCTWSDLVDGEALRSDDGGATWSLLGNALHHAMTSVTVGLDGTVHVSGDALVTRSDDGGSTWEAAATGLPVSEGIYVVSASPSVAGRLLACNDSGLWSSIDGADTWTQVNDRSCRSVAWGWSCGGGGPDDELAAVVTWDDAVLLSIDGGSTFSDITTDLAPAVPTVVGFSQSDRSLYAGTVEDGVWSTEVCEPVLFWDGFESGTVEGWDSSTP
ncbi:MAG: sialidase family protein [Acidobacteriota bacterium]